ncbi:MAG TPA: hypothetical protein DC046_10450, partial [Rhodospirillaceae bacterium]|nr:hypothetical protein [Rhodospirillaceae bacterium]
MSLVDGSGSAVAGLSIGPDGAVLTLGGVAVAVGTALLPRTWYQVQAVIDLGAGTLRVTQAPVHGAGVVDDTGDAETTLPADAA